MELKIPISYGQLCVFDPSFDAPYNAWADDHVAQGFSWRPGSVSFAVDDDCALAVVKVAVADGPPQLDAAESAIRTPFVAAATGTVEIGSILSGFEVALPPGPYALYFLTPRGETQPFQLIFVPADEVTPAVLKEGRNAKIQSHYLMEASPA
ncbi:MULTISPECIES: competence protein ComJ [unclassified Phenylobacterium]|uniref:competence protein ComJ n=1 Tax=unclassified Phenylobacterium TaxID=2640670 RepID=UPI002264ED4E|nr:MULTISPECIES: competence protein ComJ [unclassified Phenylobacterium]MBS0490216.1 hypothetical protein [Pseudomonadota bacterium]MCX7588108.1 competence protein ComJ [Phenylobacterium sp. 58.2.17]WGU41739.1 competence protein ComJ [Phenylobacterium sp. NIBR 498073]